jgi:ABC-type Zn2+ transport system substrate-binding protein/surface adhesin
MQNFMEKEDEEETIDAYVNEKNGDDDDNNNNNNNNNHNHNHNKSSKDGIYEGSVVFLVASICCFVCMRTLLVDDDEERKIAVY